MTAPPVIVLGVRRSGTTLLRVMLDRSSELAIPDESYFVPQLARRHRGPIDRTAFLDDVARLGTLRDWELDDALVASLVEDGMLPGDAIGAIFAAYASLHGKTRWGDKTPLYMQHLPLLEQLWPTARFVHLVRDGRDAALSFLSVPPGIMTRGWGYPADAAGFGRQWRTEVEAASALGDRVGPARYLEVRYEGLVAEPEATLQSICMFVDLPWEPAMLDYVGRSDSARKRHQQRLNQPPTVGVRDWRTEMSEPDVSAFEQVAGDVLGAHGYETTTATAPTGKARLGLVRYRLEIGAWNGVGAAIQRSPLWARRHPRLTP